VLVALASLAVAAGEARVLGHPVIEGLVVAILLGMVIRTAWTPPARVLPGVAFTATQVLEVAVCLLAAVAGFVAGRLFDQPGLGVVLAAVAAIAAVALAGGAALLVGWSGAESRAADGRVAFQMELDRARRHRRTFAMARLELATAQPSGSGPAETERVRAASTIGLIAASLRITDRVWLDDGDAVILLPESDRSTAEAFADRLRTATPNLFSERWAIAAFPDDGLTSGALLDALERGMMGGVVPSPMIRTRVANVVEELATAAEAIAGGEPAESGIG